MTDSSDPQVSELRKIFGDLNEQFQLLRAEVIIDTARSLLAGGTAPADAQRIIEAETPWEAVNRPTLLTDVIIRAAETGGFSDIDAVRRLVRQTQFELQELLALTGASATDMQIFDHVVNSSTTELDVAGILRDALSNERVAGQLDRAFGAALAPIAYAYARQTDEQLGDGVGALEIGSNPIGDLNLAGLAVDATRAALRRNEQARLAPSAAFLLRHLGVEVSRPVESMVALPPAEPVPGFDALLRQLTPNAVHARAATALGLLRDAQRGVDLDESNGLIDRLLSELSTDGSRPEVAQINELIDAVASGQQRPSKRATSRALLFAIDNLLTDSRFREHAVRRMAAEDQAATRDRLEHHQPASYELEARGIVEGHPTPELAHEYRRLLLGKPLSGIEEGLGAVGEALQEAERYAVDETRSLLRVLRQTGEDVPTHAHLLSPTIATLDAVVTTNAEHQPSDDLEARLAKLTRASRRPIENALGAAAAVAALAQATQSWSDRNTTGTRVWRMARAAGTAASIRLIDADAALRTRGEVGASMALAPAINAGLSETLMTTANLRPGLAAASLLQPSMYGNESKWAAGYLTGRAARDPHSVEHVIDNVAAAFEDATAITARQLPAAGAIAHTAGRFPQSDKLWPLALSNAASEFRRPRVTVADEALRVLDPAYSSVDGRAADAARVVDLARREGRRMRWVRHVLEDAGTLLVDTLSHIPTTDEATLRALPPAVAQHVPEVARALDAHGIDRPPEDNRREPYSRFGINRPRRTTHSRPGPEPDTGPENGPSGGNAGGVRPPSEPRTGPGGGGGATAPAPPQSARRVRLRSSAQRSRTAEATTHDGQTTQGQPTQGTSRASARGARSEPRTPIGRLRAVMARRNRGPSPRATAAAPEAARPPTSTTPRLSPPPQRPAIGSGNEGARSSGAGRRTDTRPGTGRASSPSSGRPQNNGGRSGVGRPPPGRPTPGSGATSPGGS